MKALLLFAMLAISDQPRQVLLFYNPSGAAMHTKQLAVFSEEQAGLKEREVVVQSFSGESAGNAWKKWKVDSAQPFTFILIGKDGGEKHRADKPVSAKELFGLIDAMPMRRNEQKRNP